MVSAENQKGSEELLPAPVIPRELNPEGLISVVDARKGFQFECKVNQAFRNDVLSVLIDDAPTPIFNRTIEHDIGPESPPFEFILPIRFATEGFHHLRQQLNGAQPSPKKQFIIDFTPHYSSGAPPAPRPPADLPDGKVTSIYLDDNGGVLFSFEDPEDWAPGDTMRLYWGGSDGVPLETVPLREFGNTYLLTATVIRSTGPGRFLFYYVLMDLAGNVSQRSRSLSLEVDI
ncbi:hypothetical protein C4K03_2887 [Pseudomonas synxantha]|uniref:Uncharacterized protein n=1 Tax=Pseudomonas synxantha TaxID=47883 RepID=A0A3G7U8U7_9PSED|nr:hypothetical protein [Pseudomonas synxantha]AZE55042.1 hypothetical protein C4K03_2887 [Pseudomonas synxantha]